MTTDTSERGIERLICSALTGAPCEPGASVSDAVHQRPAAYGPGWICGDPNGYDREYCVDLVQLRTFLRVTQPKVAEALDLETDDPARHRFLARLRRTGADRRRGGGAGGRGRRVRGGRRCT